MSVHPQIKAAFYLSPSLDDLWRWSEDGEVLTWADGTTIAFRAEVERVLRRLAPGGLPPFGAVALLLGACRDGWADSHGRQTISGYAGAFARMVGPPAGGAPMGCAAHMVFARVGHHISQLIAGLDSIGSLPPALREKSDARQVLAETVFEGLENRGSVEDAQAVIRALDDGISPESLRPRLSQEESLSQFSRQVDGLSRGLGRVDAQSLANRIKTGLDQDLIAPDEDLSPPQRVRRLLAALRDDQELGGLARLAHDLMAAVTIPRSLHAREDLPAGGVSDLSNRGPLDRLLVSELAHDDLTLAVRVAVNEALYLRRESPPSEPPHRRAILLDLGIRTWGVPRLYGIATGLALACTTDPKVQFDFFRAAASGVEALDVTKRPGVESLLSALEPSPHPAQSFEAFFDRLDHPEDPDESRFDAILVTHPDVLADEEFLAALDPYREKLNYLATVDRDGSFALWALSRRGMKLVRQAKLSLEQILAPPAQRPRVPPAPLLSDEERRLPAILYADPFPFLLPHRANPRTSAVSAKLGLVTVTDDGRLLHWQDGTRGGRQIAARLPRGLVRLVHLDELLGSAQVVITSRHNASAFLISVQLSDGKRSTTRFNLDVSDPQHVFAREGVVYFVHRRAIYAHSLADGTKVASLTLKQRIVWERGRFVRVGGAWHAIAYNGSRTLRLEPLKVPEGTIALFDVPHKGPGAICAVQPGRLVNIANDFTMDFPFRQEQYLQVLGVSPDGLRIAVRQNNDVKLLQIVASSIRHYTVSRDSVEEALLAPTIYFSTQSMAVPRVRFKGIYIDSEKRLSLISRKNVVFRLDLDHNDRLVLRADYGAREMPNVRPFEPVRKLQEFRLRMHKAQWPDGSTAWLDARGLLHLKSSDESIPEMSFTLGNIGPAAWSSAGSVCGPAYFIGDQQPVAATFFMSLLRRFVGRLL